MSESSQANRTSAAHAALYMAPMMISSVLPLVTLPLFTRALSKEDYGLWGIATAVGALLSGAATLGIQIGYERNYFAANDARKRKHLLWSVVLAAAVQQLVVGGLLVIFQASIAQRLMGRPEAGYMLLLAFASAALGSIKLLFLTTLRNEGRARDYVLFSIDELFLGAGISLVAVLWLRVGPVGLLFGPLVASSTVLGLVAARFARMGDVGFDAVQLRDTMKVSLPLAPRVLIGAVSGQIDKVVLGTMGSLAAVGLYTIGHRMAQFVFAWMTALQNVYQPQVYRMLFADAAPRAIGSYLMPYAYAGAGLSMGVTLFAGEILALVTPPEYAGAAPVLATLSVYFGLLFFGKQPQLVFAKRTGLVSGLSLVTVTMNAVGVYVGAQSGGPTGAALGMLLAWIVVGSINLVLAHRYAPIVYPYPAVVLVFSALPMALGLSLWLYLASVPTAGGIILKILALGLFAVIGWNAGLLSTALADIRRVLKLA